MQLSAAFHHREQLSVPQAHYLGRAREQAIETIFAAHCLPLIRLATLLGADDPEDIVAEAFYQLYRRWHRLRDPDAAVAYVRSVICNLTRMRLRHLRIARRHLVRSASDPTTFAPTTFEGIRDDQRVVVDALKALPARQREALVLRYWLDLREAEIAATMNISAGAVKSHIFRGIATLARVFDESEREAHESCLPGLTP